MSSFFTLPGSVKKRKRTDSGAKSQSHFKRPREDKGAKRRKQDDDTSSDSEDETGGVAHSGSEDNDEELLNETAAEKRLRLAEQYLEQVREEASGDGAGFDAADIDRDLISERLHESVAESAGKLHRHLSNHYSFAPESTTSTLFRADNESTTSIAVCLPHVYTVTKDCYLNKWILPAYPPPPSERRSLTPSRKLKRIKFTRGSRRKDENFVGHIDQILCVAASDDGRFVATGGKDNRLVIWKAENLKVLKVFKQHRGAVTSLVFRRGTSDLYSCSTDRTIKLWNLEALAYIDTLFGHQDEVVGIAALALERCVTVGARDRSARLWKIVDETQLVFNGGVLGKAKDGKAKYAEGSMDCIAMVDEEHFVTGSDNGNLCLWSMQKKKPVFTVPLAHGLDPPLLPEQASAETYPSKTPPCPPQPRYITSVATIPYSDLVFSGSWDGSIKVWRVAENKRKLEAVTTIEGDEGVRGVINGIAVCERGEKGKEVLQLLVGTGKEPKWGRGFKVPGRNGGYCIEVPRDGGGISPNIE